MRYRKNIKGGEKKIIDQKAILKTVSRGTALFLAAVLFAGSILTGCASTEKSSKSRKNNGSADHEITVAINSETGSLDPAGSIALTYLAYSVSALDELLTFDENGEIEYRAAQSYEVNEDFTTWTFHLRKDALWSDGGEVTSADFKNTIVRALDPESGSGYAVYLFPILNAEKIYNKEADIETLGVELPDDKTIVFHLEKPCVYFLDLLRLPVYTPSCSKYADAANRGWEKDPKTSLSNGPFYLAEYVPNQYFTLKKNEYYWGKDNISLEKITYRFFDDTQSMAAAYETGEVDVATALPSSVMELYDGKEDLFVTDQIATRYIYFNLNVKPFDDVRVREAFNLAVDREELCKIVGEDTEPTYNLVAKYMKDKNTGKYFTEEAEQPFEENIERAQKLLAEAGYPEGKGFPELTYSYPSLELDSDTAQVIREQLKKNLNIEIKLNAQELQTNYSMRHAGNFDLCRMNWTADFSDPYTYLSMLLSDSTYNCSGIKNEQYDELVGRSDSETDPVKRSALMHEAEQLAVGEQFYILPLYAMKSVNLVNPKIEGIRQIPASGALEYRYAKIRTGHSEK